MQRRHWLVANIWGAGRVEQAAGGTDAVIPFTCREVTSTPVHEHVPKAVAPTASRLISY